MISTRVWERATLPNNLQNLTCGKHFIQNIWQVNSSSGIAISFDFFLAREHCGISRFVPICILVVLCGKMASSNPFGGDALVDVPTTSLVKDDTSQKPVVPTAGTLSSGYGSGTGGEDKDDKEKKNEKDDTARGSGDGDEPSDDGNSAGDDAEEGGEEEVATSDEEVDVNELDGNPYANYSQIALLQFHADNKSESKRLQKELKQIEQVFEVSHPETRVAQALVTKNARSDKGKKETQDKTDAMDAMASVYVRDGDRVETFTLKLSTTCCKFKKLIAKRFGIPVSTFYVVVPNGDPMPETSKRLYNAGIRAECTCNISILGDGGAKGVHQKIEKRKKEILKLKADIEPKASSLRGSAVLTTVSCFNELQVAMGKVMENGESDPRAMLEKLLDTCDPPVLGQIVEALSNKAGGGNSTEAKLKKTSQLIYGDCVIKTLELKEECDTIIQSSALVFLFLYHQMVLKEPSFDLAALRLMAVTAKAFKEGQKSAEMDDEDL